jgi:hypothetical protein
VLADEHHLDELPRLVGDRPAVEAFGGDVTP